MITRVIFYWCYKTWKKGEKPGNPRCLLEGSVGVHLEVRGRDDLVKSPCDFWKTEGVSLQVSALHDGCKLV